MKFCDETDKYTVLKLPLNNYKHVPHFHDKDIEIAGSNKKQEISKDEKRILKSYFRNWTAPFYGNLKGWKESSPIYLLKDGCIIGGLYACCRNEFNDDIHWGQLHYFFIDKEFRGKGYHKLLFHEGVRRAKSWNLEGVYINTDRFGLPEVYQRWGAVFWKEILKSSSSLKHPNKKFHNWLTYKIHDEALERLLKKFASGILVDVGCGEKPYVALTGKLVSEHIGIDHPGSEYDYKNADIIASAYDIGLQEYSIETVICTAVLEHLEKPEDALREMHRILKRGGHIILSTPLFWHLHEEPRDFFRYTENGLRFLFEKVGFEIVEIYPLSGFVVTFAIEASYFLNLFKRSRGLTLIINFLQWFIQKIAQFLNKFDKSYHFTWMYMLVARKSESN